MVHCEASGVKRKERTIGTELSKGPTRPAHGFGLQDGSTTLGKIFSLSSSCLSMALRWRDYGRKAEWTANGAGRKQADRVREFGDGEVIMQRRRNVATALLLLCLFFSFVIATSSAIYCEEQR